MKHSLLILFLLLTCPVFGGGVAQGQEADTLEEKKTFELSFGQSMLFISNSKVVDIRNKEGIVIPTSAILFFAEFRPLKRLRVPVFFNIPTESKQFLVNNQLVNERASVDFGIGIEYGLFQLKIDSKTTIELSVAMLADLLFPEIGQLKLSPLAVGRLRIVQNKNFVMYLGSSYVIGIYSWGLIYGTGFIF